MNDLTVKQVDFFGDILIAAQDKEGNIWTGISYICNGIGFSKNEKDAQVKRVKGDLVLQKGCVKFDAGVFDPNNETIALKVDFVPLWLAKITITPTMKQEQPKLVEKLVQYQLKAKDVLAEAFLPKKARTKNKASKQPSLSATNTAMKLIIPQLEAAGVDPVQRTYFLKDVYATVGINVPMVRKEQEKLYELTEIAKALGVYSKTGNPHAQAIGAIVGQLDIDEDGIVKTSFSKNGHTDISNQYKESVLHQVEGWLKENDFPTSISNGAKSFSVAYKDCKVYA